MQRQVLLSIEQQLPGQRREQGEVLPAVEGQAQSQAGSRPSLETRQGFPETNLHRRREQGSEKSAAEGLRVTSWCLPLSIAVLCLEVSPHASADPALEGPQDLLELPERERRQERRAQTPERSGQHSSLEPPLRRSKLDLELLKVG